MSRALSTLLALILLLAAALPVAANDPEPPKSPDVAGIVPGEVVVKWRDADRGPDVARARGLGLVADMAMPGKGLASVLSTGGRPVDAVVAELASDPAVEYAEPNYVVTLAEEGSVTAVGVNDPLTAGQYSLDRMGVRDAWSLAKGGSNIVAVLDTGVQPDHRDLQGRVLPGHDFVNSDSDAADDNGHGTWVAGIIAANANDGYGVAGISWSDKILPVKIMNSSGTGSTTNLTSGIVWAADQGATVINMSVGGFPYSKYVEDAVDYAWSKGVVLVGAAGNNNRREDFYPASYANVISVSATQPQDEFSHWSSYGPKVEVSAPGSSVQTTNCTASSCPNRGWGDHTYISGTSFATPNVAGVVALIKARYPSYTPSQIVGRLYATVDDLGYAGRDDRYGRGRVNAYRALGGSVAYVAAVAGDGLEGNNGLGSAKLIGLGKTTQPTIYPAGDEDWFAVDVPRAGRLDVRVTGVVDTRNYPWNRSSLPVDSIVELYTTSGTFIKRVDNEWESGTELAQHSVSGATRIVIRVLNYYANGSPSPYSVTPTYVDTVAPTAALVSPSTGATNVSRFIDPVVGFSEPVSGISPSSLRLRDMDSGELVTASVRYDPATRQAVITPSADRLAAAHTFRVEATSSIVDAAGNSISPASRSFTTGTPSFTDTAGTTFEPAIEWAFAAKVTTGCTGTRFCPTDGVDRAEMATFLARVLVLSPTTIDAFTDDDAHSLEVNINRLAAAGLTSGCGTRRFCPHSEVTRAQMASFLVRALRLPPTSIDAFTDDEASTHEDAINRLAAAGIVAGCADTLYCPHASVTREQMAAFLHRAFRDR